MSSSSGSDKPKLGTIRIGDLGAGISGIKKIDFSKNASKNPFNTKSFGSLNGDSFNGGGFRGKQQSFQEAENNEKQDLLNQIGNKGQFHSFDIKSSFRSENKVEDKDDIEDKNADDESKDDKKISEEVKKVNQFRRADLTFAKNNTFEGDKKAENGNNGNNKGSSFNQGFRDRKQFGGFQKQNDGQRNFRGNFQNQDNRKNGSFGGGNRVGQGRDFGNGNRGNGFGNNGNNGFGGNRFQQNGKNFVFKSNKVNVKRNDNYKQNNDNRQVFKKTSNTGSNVDKYSINGMLKTMSNNIELDTEIDDILGNVIAVKLSGINTSNSLQKERKVRKSSAKNEGQVRFSTPIVREIVVYNNSITLGELAKQMAISTKELNKLLASEGYELEDDSPENTIEGDIAEIMAEICGHRIVKRFDDEKEKSFFEQINQNRKEIKQRDPIVTIMGHVDHGKTTLLDTIRKASVASGEAGGITQHIGAYKTKIGNRGITFLDTPGHSAFTQMRARGAQITDIVVIVVSADDGIMPQTIEAINHAKSAGVPIIVAINKIDKPEADIERTKNMLLQYEVVPEELGGDVMVVPISAKSGTNIDKLLNAIILQADVLDLKAYYDGCAEGVVVESKLDKKRGALITIIVKNGTLKQGDFVVAGDKYGKIKGMFDENGKMLKEATPSTPVEILGLNATPDAGEAFFAVKNEKDVKGIIDYRANLAKQKGQNSATGLSSNDILSRIQGKDNSKSVSFIIKADTKGSLEAIVGTINEMKDNDVKPKIIHSGIGSVVDNDVLLATTCGAYVFTFNVQKADKKVLEFAEQKSVDVRDYRIIYEMFDDIEKILEGKLEPVIKKTTLGNAEVKAIFEITKVGKIAGCLVKEGIIQRGAKVSVMRNGNQVFETTCTSLKHGKENVKDIHNGQECGVGLEKIDEVQSGDILEFFVVKEEKRM